MQTNLEDVFDRVNGANILHIHVAVVPQKEMRIVWHNPPVVALQRLTPHFLHKCVTAIFRAAPAILRILVLNGEGFLPKLLGVSLRAEGCPSNEDLALVRAARAVHHELGDQLEKSGIPDVVWNLGRNALVNGIFGVRSVRLGVDDEKVQMRQPSFLPLNGTQVTNHMAKDVIF
jgi:hypothetical protein